jgi:hypothetical protein
MSIKIEHLDVLMRQRVHVHWHKKQAAQAAKDEAAYRAYLSSALIGLCSLLDIKSVSPCLADAFEQPDFWELQLSGAAQIQALLEPKSSLERIKEVLKQAPPWLILRLIPARQMPANLPFKTKSNFLQVYLPVPAIAKAALALREIKEQDSMMFLGIKPVALEPDVEKAKLLTCQCALATPMSDRLADLAAVEGGELALHHSVLTRESPLTQEEAEKLPVIFYKHWEIFCRELPAVASEISCSWAVQPPLTVSTGTLAFLEKAIDRWKTIDRPHALLLQSEEDVQAEFREFANKNKTAGLKAAFLDWVSAGCPRGEVLKYCATHGQYVEQARDKDVHDYRNLKGRFVSESGQREGKKRQRSFDDAASSSRADYKHDPNHQGWHGSSSWDYKGSEWGKNWQ